MDKPASLATCAFKTRQENESMFLIGKFVSCKQYTDKATKRKLVV
jgi:hypothetical protein